jgi:hypothetical protein
MVVAGGEGSMAHRLPGIWLPACGAAAALATATASAQQPPPLAYGTPQTAPAPAPQPYPAPGAERHDGFFLRLAAGFGFGGNTGTDAEGAEDVMRGGASTSSVAIGACVVEDLAVHAELFHAALVAPEVLEDDVVIVDTVGKYGMFGAGVGITYYFMPTNLYLSAALAATVLYADFGVVAFKSDAGVGLDFLIGKEWWVSDNWGLGVAGQFIFSNTPSDFDEPNRSFAGAVLFSASYN